MKACKETVKVPKFICQICGASLSSKNALKEHCYQHAQSKDVRCNYCGTQFYNKSKHSIHYMTCTAKKGWEEHFHLQREGTEGNNGGKGEQNK